jgi:Brp/Blh family beta-carotene 15,15'-monooxygenase
LTKDALPAGYWLQNGALYATLSFAGILALLVFIPIYQYMLGVSPKLIVGWMAQTLFWCVFLYVMPLYVGFAFYFGCWHSLLSFDLIRQQLALPPTSNGWLELIKKALPFSVLALAGIGALLFFFSADWQLNSSMGYIFMGIAILTLPHLQVFSGLVDFVAAARKK